MLDERNEQYLRNPRYHQLITLSSFQNGLALEDLTPKLGKNAHGIAFELVSKGVLSFKNNTFYSNLADTQSSMACVLDRIRMSTEYYDHDKRGSGLNAAFYIPLRLNQKARSRAHQLTKEYFAKICKLPMEFNQPDETGNQTFFVSALMDDFDDPNPAI